MDWSWTVGSVAFYIYRSMIRGGNPRQVKGNNDYSQRLISDGLSMVGEVFEFM